LTEEFGARQAEREAWLREQGLWREPARTPVQPTPTAQRPVQEVGAIDESELDDILLDIEHEIRNKPIEYGHVVDPRTGATIWLKQGDESSVSWTKRELDKMVGAVLTHNHPSGNSFSREDITLLLKYNLGQIRAAGPTGNTFAMYAPTSPINLSSFEQDVDIIEQEIRREFIGMIRDGAMSIDDANKMHHHELWTRAAEQYADFGLTYEVIR